MNKYLILLVCVCMAVMFVLINKRLDLSDKKLRVLDKEFCYSAWAAQRNANTFNNVHIKEFNDVVNSINHINHELIRLFPKNDGSYPCVSTGMYIKD